MLPTPCIGQTGKKLGKQSCILGGILPPPVWLKCFDICICAAAAKKLFLAMRMHVHFLFSEPWVLAAYPQASVCGATGKQYPKGTEILTNDELSWISRCLETGPADFCKVQPPGNVPGWFRQWDKQFHASLLPYNTSAYFLRWVQSSSPHLHHHHHHPQVLEKICLPSGGGLYNYNPRYFLPTRP